MNGATLFINDEKTNELYTEVGEGLDEKSVIRFPNHLGIAGTVFTSGKPVNIPHAYADLRFNPSFDKQTGFFTRSILCMPVLNKEGKTIGVSQVLNKRGVLLIQKTRKGWQLLPLRFRWVLKTPSCLTMYKTKKTTLKVSFLVCMMQY